MDLAAVLLAVVDGLLAVVLLLRGRLAERGHLRPGAPLAHRAPEARTAPHRAAAAHAAAAPWWSAGGATAAFGAIVAIAVRPPADAIGAAILLVAALGLAGAGARRGRRAAARDAVATA